MIRLKREVDKSAIMREMKAEAEISFEKSWEKEVKVQAYMNGVHDLLKKLRINDNIAKNKYNGELL